MKIKILTTTIAMAMLLAFTPAIAQDYSQEEVSFTNSNDGAVLAGTLLMPKGIDKPTVVLMVTGSGLQNRDEEILGHKPFKAIAVYLAERGIATLRYDDRSFGKSTGSIDGATTQTFMQDAQAGVDYLRGLDKFSKVGVLGHSEGGTIAFLMAAEGNADFIISLAGGGQSGKEIVLSQNYNAMKLQGATDEQIGPFLDMIEEVFDKMIASPEDEPFSDMMKRIESESQSPELVQMLAAQLSNESNGKWYKYYLALDPSDAISKITCPVMAINGTKDFQVDCKENLEKIRKLLKPSDKNLVKSYEDLNHLFLKCKTGLPTEYQSLEGDIDAEVLNDMATWISGLK